MTQAADAETDGAAETATGALTVRTAGFSPFPGADVEKFGREGRKTGVFFQRISPQALTSPQITAAHKAAAQAFRTLFIRDPSFPRQAPPATGIYTPEMPAVCRDVQEQFSLFAFSL